MKKKDFRFIYTLIKQRIIIGPIVTFIKVFDILAYGTIGSIIISIIGVLSSMICIYACQALLIASKELLNVYNINYKFKLVQFGVIVSSIINGIISIIGINSYNHIYTSDVMSNAYIAFISICGYFSLSIGFRKYFGTKNAAQALKNVLNQSFKESSPKNINQKYHGDSYVLMDTLK